MESIRMSGIIHHDYPQIKDPGEGGRESRLSTQVGVVFLTNVSSFQRQTKQCPSVLAHIDPTDLQLGAKPRIKVSV